VNYNSSQDIFSQQKPWSELADRTALSKPPNLGEVLENVASCAFAPPPTPVPQLSAHSRTRTRAQAISRIKKNTAYFRVNYCVGVVATCAASFLFHPTSLIVLGLLMVAWGYLVFVKQSPIVISGRQIR
jgi:hypothetical protein